MTDPEPSPASISRELVRLGFHEYDDTGPGGATWAHPAHQDGITVLVPREKDHELAGYRETLDSAVERLSWITEESVDTIRRRLTNGPDHLEMRVVHQLTARNSLRVLDAQRVMTGFVELIKNGARTAFNGARVIHTGPGGPDYDAALNGIEILAPTAGSFRLIAVSTDEPQLAISPPVSHINARESLEAALIGLYALATESRRAADLSEPDVEQLVDAGVSRQALNAVQELAIGHTAGLTVEFLGRFDPSLGPVRAPRGPVIISDAQISLARELGDRLRSLEPAEDTFVDGWIETARASGYALEGLPSGTVVVRQPLGNKRFRDIIVELDQKLFSRVQPGVTAVRMSGTLERISGRWHLTDPQNISILTDRPSY